MVPELVFPELVERSCQLSLERLEELLCRLLVVSLSMVNKLEDFEKMPAGEVEPFVAWLVSWASRRWLDEQAPICTIRSKVNLGVTS
eukprot:6266691-Amphidinium_carterae.1